MITIYRRQNGIINLETLQAGQPVPQDTIWIDINSPTSEEEVTLEAQLGVQIPSREEVWKNQVLNRLYQENDVAYMTAALITKIDSPFPQTSSVTFILTSGYLLTIRYISPTSFQNFSARVQRNAQKFQSSAHVLEGLLEEIITRVAHNSEMVVDMLDNLSHGIFTGEVLKEKSRNTSQVMKAVLNSLGKAADLNSKINESLHSLNRMLSFFKTVNTSSYEIDKRIEILLTDVLALNKQTAFLSDKITFQLDATLGMINIEQNLIIKIFSVVTVFFLPPTLISSLYGMNFRDMQELNWTFGYPMAVTLMALCAIVPFMFFRRKGWL